MSAMPQLCPLSVSDWLQVREGLPAVPEALADQWDSRWGRYFPGQVSASADGALRVMLFVGSELGLGVLRSLLALQTAGAPVRVVSVATDDVMDRKARIFLKRRIWRYYSVEERHALQAEVELIAQSLGIPVFTGDVKSQVFQSILDEWAPDCLISYVFGQLIPPRVFQRPALGSYNFHPSDLSSGEGRGTMPIEEAIAAGRRGLPTACHHIDEAFDTGPVVGQGRDTPLLHARCDGEAVLDVVRRLAPEGGRMVQLLVLAIARQRAVVHSLDFCPRPERAALRLAPLRSGAPCAQHVSA